MSESVSDELAREQIRGHIDVCTERYGNIWTALSEIKDAMQENNKLNHDRFSTISNRMWIVMSGTCGAAVVGLCIIIFYLITQRHV